MNAVVTVVIGKAAEQWAAYTLPYLERYAARIGSDFVVIRELISGLHPWWSKFRGMDLFAKYDRIIFVDSDVYVTPACYNLFDVVPYTHVGVQLDPSDAHERVKDISAVRATFGNVFDGNILNAEYFCAGLMVLSRKHVSVQGVANSTLIHWDRLLKYNNSVWPEQTTFNYLLSMPGYPRYYLSREHHAFVHKDRYCYKTTGMAHYGGRCKRHIAEDHHLISAMYAGNMQQLI